MSLYSSLYYVSQRWAIYPPIPLISPFKVIENDLKGTGRTEVWGFEKNHRGTRWFLKLIHRTWVRGGLGGTPRLRVSRLRL
jgi:hypothetical protein